MISVHGVEDARIRAEARFKRGEQMKADAEKALAQVEAERAATLEKTVRLRALRLAKEEADRHAADQRPRQPAKAAQARPTRRRTTFKRMG